MEKDLITLTHVCRSWRAVLISQSFLWSRLDFTNVEKTHVYIERSKSAHLDIFIKDSRTSPYRKDAFLLVIPHVGRVRSIVIHGGRQIFQDFTEHFSCSVPVLRALYIHPTGTSPPIFNETLFNGDLSFLSKLTLYQIAPLQSWKLSRLTTFRLTKVLRVSMTQLLDFFMNAPLLSRVYLYSIPGSSDAPSGRLVSLPHLENLLIIAHGVHSSTLLNHLSIPAGAFIKLPFYSGDHELPISTFLPSTHKYLQNISSINSVSLEIDTPNLTLSIKLDARRGGLKMYGSWNGFTGITPVTTFSHEILQSLNYFTLSKIQSLEIKRYGIPGLDKINEPSPRYTLNTMKVLHTLSLNECNNLPFILALNPDNNPSNLLLCPKLESLNFYVKEKAVFDIKELVNMAKKRALKGVQLQWIGLVAPGEPVPKEEVFKLREHVVHVEYIFAEE